MTKPTKWPLCLTKTQISLGIRLVWSESSLSAWRKLGSLATRWLHREDSDQTGRMHRLIWLFAGRKVISLDLSWGGSYSYSCSFNHGDSKLYETSVGKTTSNCGAIIGDSFQVWRFTKLQNFGYKELFYEHDCTWKYSWKFLNFKYLPRFEQRYPIYFYNHWLNHVSRSLNHSSRSLSL